MVSVMEEEQPEPIPIQMELKLQDTQPLLKNSSSRISPESSKLYERMMFNPRQSRLLIPIAPNLRSTNSFMESEQSRASLMPSDRMHHTHGTIGFMPRK